jgi:hypothetical protein
MSRSIGRDERLTDTGIRGSVAASGRSCYGEVRGRPARRSGRRPAELGGGLRRNVERDALTVKGDLSKRISLSMTQPAPRTRFYIALRFAPRPPAAIGRSGFAAFHKRSGSPPSDETAPRKLLSSDRRGCFSPLGRDAPSPESRAGRPPCRTSATGLTPFALVAPEDTADVTESALTELRCFA